MLLMYLFGNVGSVIFPPPVHSPQGKGDSLLSLLSDVWVDWMLVVVWSLVSYPSECPYSANGVSFWSVLFSLVDWHFVACLLSLPILYFQGLLWSILFSFRNIPGVVSHLSSQPHTFVYRIYRHFSSIHWYCSVLECWVSMFILPFHIHASTCKLVNENVHLYLFLKGAMNFVAVPVFILVSSYPSYFQPDWHFSSSSVVSAHKSWSGTE